MSVLSEFGGRPVIDMVVDVEEGEEERSVSVLSLLEDGVGGRVITGSSSLPDGMDGGMSIGRSERLRPRVMNVAPLDVAPLSDAEARGESDASSFSTSSIDDNDKGFGDVRLDSVRREAVKENGHRRVAF
jgi:hypothetical protein